MSKPTDLVQGTLDLLLLKIVALEALHGRAIGQRLKQVTVTCCRSAKVFSSPRCTPPCVH